MTPQSQILTVGDELLRGDVIDTNATWLAGRLESLGLQVQRITSVGDDLAPLTRAVQEAAGRCQVLAISGGLGPTDDDRTTLAVAEAAGLPLELRPDALEALRQRFLRHGYVLTPNNEKQAWFPRGARLLENRHGTAPGFALELDGCFLFCLPGVPGEMKALFEEEVAPLLALRLGCRPPAILSLHTLGVGESQIDHRLQGVLQRVDSGSCHCSVHFRTSFPTNTVTLVVRPGPGCAPEEAAAVLGRLEREVRPLVEEFVFATGLTTFAEAVVGALKEAGATVALAESCTGGLAGDLLTSAAGSSEVFELGVVSYANSAKERILGVPPEVLSEHGAVSQPCVEAMARGVRDLARSTFGVAISGVAGPGGGSAKKPVGTVHLALASAQDIWHLERRFPFERQRVKVASAHAALAMVLKKLGKLGRNANSAAKH